MIKIRRSSERGHFNHGWLDTYHTFSFAEYFDRNHMNFRSLRVINEDRVAAGQGFGAHSHKDMEILTYVLSGQIAHKDSMGHEETLGAGEIQRMTAGSGVTHSEFNPLPKEALHLLQIWIMPEEKNLTPGYEQKKIRVAEKKNEFHLIAAKNPPPEAVKIHQDVNLYAGIFEKGKTASLKIASGRAAWIHVAKGNMEISGHKLEAGDALSAENETSLELKALEDSEILFFDLM